jgi:hypothetical protein
MVFRKERRHAMHISMQQEQFSKAWVRAVAAVAGYNITSCEVDDDSVDLGFTGNRKDGVHVRAPKLEFQLKCQSNDDGSRTHLAYALAMKNYDDLRDPEVHVPRILVVCCVPENVSDWLQEDAEATALRRCAYWLSLRGFPAVPNETTRSVRLPRSQLFCTTALREIMERIGTGGLP